MKKLNATLYKVDGSKEPLILDEKDNLKVLQKLVGGLIEVIFIVPEDEEEQGIFDNGKDLIINEEGLLLELPINPFSHLVGFNSRWQGEVFRGDMVLVEGVLR